MSKIQNLKNVLLYSQDLNYDFTKVQACFATRDIKSYKYFDLISNRSDVPQMIDAVLTFGGDGTFLRGANIATQFDAPVIGFNHGHLGFLCSFPNEMEEQGILALIDEELTYNLSSRLHITQGNSNFTAFNDFVIKHGESGRLLDLALELNGEPITRFIGDGLIVSTPAGSTGYNLGAGGPIISSNAKCFIVTPICPHSFTNRPIVFSEADVLNIKLLNHAETHFIPDGVKSPGMQQNEVITIQKAAKSSKVVLPHANVFHTLQDKMNWQRL